MKKIIMCFFVIGFFMSVISAVYIPDLEIEKIDKGAVVIVELEKPATFDLVINNIGEPDTFEVYTLVGIRIEPWESFELPTGVTTITIEVYPSEEIRKNREGPLSFEYEIKGRNSGIFKDKLSIKIIKLVDAIEIRSEPLRPEDSTATLKIKNKENVSLGDLNFEFDSPFFTAIKNVSLGANEETQISVLLNKDGREKILAGPYIIATKIILEDEEMETEGIIELLEEESTSVEKFSEGFLIRKTSVKKINIGSTPTTANVEITKDIVSRLFTMNSPETLIVERSGLFITYRWEKELNPGESFVAESTTNYTFPFVLLILIISVGIAARIYFRKPIILNKSVSFVRTRGGEFALKVKLHVKARKHLDKVKITDTLPSMAKLYEKFGRKPDKIDKDMRHLSWDIGDLVSGEERVFSYIIYSKLNVVGRFELPVASAIFESKGKIDRFFSNRAFFAAEKD